MTAVSHTPLPLTYSPFSLVLLLLLLLLLQCGGFGARPVDVQQLQGCTYPLLVRIYPSIMRYCCCCCCCCRVAVLEHSRWLSNNCGAQLEYYTAFAVTRRQALPSGALTWQWLGTRVLYLLCCKRGGGCFADTLPPGAAMRPKLRVQVIWVWGSGD